VASKRLALIQTVASMVPVFDKLCDELMPGVERFHIVDEPMLRGLLDGKPVEDACWRVVDYCQAAERGQANAVLCCCTSISSCVELARQGVKIPVMKVDEPMVDEALNHGCRIGLAATASSTLDPSTALVKQRAGVWGQQVEIDAVYCEGAYDALFKGNVKKHDHIVKGYLKEMAERNDVVLLAQPSMARVFDWQARVDWDVPILSAPMLAVKAARDLLKWV